MSHLSEEELLKRLWKARDLVSMHARMGMTLNKSTLASCDDLMEHISIRQYATPDVVDAFIELVQELVDHAKMTDEKLPTLRKAKAQPVLLTQDLSEVFTAYGALIVPPHAEVVLCYNEPDTQEGLAYIAIKPKKG